MERYRERLRKLEKTIKPPMSPQTQEITNALIKLEESLNQPIEVLRKKAHELEKQIAELSESSEPTEDPLELALLGATLDTLRATIARKKLNNLEQFKKGTRLHPRGTQRTLKPPIS